MTRKSQPCPDPRDLDQWEIIGTLNVPQDMATAIAWSKSMARRHKSALLVQPPHPWGRADKMIAIAPKETL